VSYGCQISLYPMSRSAAASDCSSASKLSVRVKQQAFGFRASKVLHQGHAAFFTADQCADGLRRSGGTQRFMAGPRPICDSDPTGSVCVDFSVLHLAILSVVFRLVHSPTRL